MKNKILGLRTTIYKVDNIKKATVWYTKAFGVKPYFNETFYVGFNIGGYELGLQPDAVKGKRGDNVITYWGVNDVKKEYARFLKSGATKHEAPQNVGGEIVVASVKDPWGNVIGLIYNPDFKV